MIVVDASTVLTTALSEDGSSDALVAMEYAVEHGASVPGNFYSEVVHALLRAERRGRIGEAGVTSILSDIIDLSLTVEIPNVHVVAAAARQFQLTAYDASYLALAIELRAPLATVDAHLRAAADASGLAWKASA